LAFALLVVCLGIVLDLVGIHKFNFFSFEFVDELGLILFVKVLLIFEFLLLGLFLKLEAKKIHQILHHN
jgi:hypothetical protein